MTTRDKPVVDKLTALFIGLNQKIVNDIISGKFSNYKLLAAIVGNADKYGQVIKCQDELLFVARPEEFLKFNPDVLIITISNDKEINHHLSQLMKFNIDFRKVWIYKDGNLAKLNLISENNPPELTEDKRPDLFVDVSAISKADNKTGVQRVVRNVYRSLDALTNKSVIPVQINQGGITTSKIFENQLFSESFNGVEYRIKFMPNDKLLILDAVWLINYDYLYLSNAIKQQSLKVYTIIYDLIPIRYYPELLTNKFKPFVDYVLQFYTSIICISKSVADDVIDYYKEQNFHREEPLQVYYCNMGFEIEIATGEIRSHIKDFVNKAKTFLMVGSVTVHKNHVTVLKTFKSIIENNPESNDQLLIIGHQGWKIDEYLNMINNDSKLKDRVLWINDGSDNEIMWAYQNCEALIFASLMEGFGLPIVEAAYFGLPIICSDIPIFHEVAGNNAIYFPPLDVNALKNIILSWNKLKSTVDSSKIKLYSWKDCAQEILDIIADKTKPYKTIQ